ncbi:unnamed protein product [Sympodiomycopsis kandeliae]
MHSDSGGSHSRISYHDVRGQHYSNGADQHQQSKTNTTAINGTSGDDMKVDVNTIGSASEHGSASSGEETDSTASISSGQESQSSYSLADSVSSDESKSSNGSTNGTQAIPSHPTSSAFFNSYVAFPSAATKQADIRTAQLHRETIRGFKWFHPDQAPSPAALFHWRKEVCRTCGVPLGDDAERMGYQAIVKKYFQPNLVKDIIDAQNHYEEYICLCQHRQHHSYQQRTAPEGVVVDRVINNVVEAVRTSRIPLHPTAHTLSGFENRKSVPWNHYQDRDKFTNEWYEWCRSSGSNEHNKLMDCSLYASHNPYSLYHKVKYGEFGSPHPYVPYSITATSAFEKSRDEQIRQEDEAVKWIAQRRSQCPTQAHLDRFAAQSTRDSDKPIEAPSMTTTTTNGIDAPGPVVEGPIGPSDSVSATASSSIPVSVPDEVVIDQEVEQPQAMTDHPQGQDTNLPVPAEQQVLPVTTATGPAPQQQAKVAAATSHSHPITVSIIVPHDLNDWIRSAVWAQLQDQPKELLDYLCDESARRLPLPQMDGNNDTLSQWSSSFTRLQPILNLAAVVTEDELPWRRNSSTEKTDKSAPPSAADDNANGQTSIDVSADTNGNASAGQVISERSRLTKETAQGHLAKSSSGPRWSSSRFPSEPPTSFKVGNLYLSSCPGKKVRLTGAVRGRGAVCRDLAVDLQRFKGLDVGTVVCCLSDAELETIGVKWEDYVREADKLGLDLLRIPIVEGHCPTSQEALEPWLNEIVLHCTLKGINVLVHCRGGVGRAGTLAACWLIKMGLVDEHQPSDDTSNEDRVSISQFQCPRPKAGRRRQLGGNEGQELMWQCIQVVRLRRSTKAIETAEQASYISNFGNYTFSKWMSRQLEQSRQDPVRATNMETRSYNHVQLTRAFYARLEDETQEWLQSEQEARIRQRYEQARKAADVANAPPTAPANNNTDSQRRAQPATDDLHLNGKANQLGSNINSRHAAQLPAVKHVNGAVADSSISVSMPTNGDSSAGDQIAPSHLPLEAVLAASQSHLDASGEPQRKRRNTNTLSIEEIRLDDDHHNTAQTGTNSEDAELEMDALPVTGRQE